MKLTEFKNKILNNIPCGEIILNSMDNDGNGKTPYVLNSVGFKMIIVSYYYY